MSFSLYISALAVTDTLALIIGKNKAWKEDGNPLNQLAYFTMAAQCVPWQFYALFRDHIRDNWVLIIISSIHTYYHWNYFYLKTRQPTGKRHTAHELGGGGGGRDSDIRKMGRSCPSQSVNLLLSPPLGKGSSPSSEPTDRQHYLPLYIEGTKYNRSNTILCPRLQTFVCVKARTHAATMIMHWQIYEGHEWKRPEPFTMQTALSLSASMSYYFSFTGCRYLLVLNSTDLSEFWYCSFSTALLWMVNLCSTLFILSMTFERFYSIIQPHKAASFNTVKRAKIIVSAVVILSIFFNIPHLFITLSVGKNCVPFGLAMVLVTGQFYYWFSLIVNFFLPFILLLIMNINIIHTLHKRLRSTMVSTKRQGQGHEHSKVQGSKMKDAEKQIFVTLFLVTFGFLILNAPAYSLFAYIRLYDYQKSVEVYAAYYLFYNISRAAYFTNFSINFFFYVISGRKFRADLLQLLSCGGRERSDNSSIPTVSEGLSRVTSDNVNVNNQRWPKMTEAVFHWLIEKKCWCFCFCFSKYLLSVQKILAKCGNPSQTTFSKLRNWYQCIFVLVKYKNWASI